MAAVRQRQRGPLAEGEVLTIPTSLCTCQQNCTERVKPKLIKKVCIYFKSIPERNQQYKYLASLIQIKAKFNNVELKSVTPGRKYRQSGFRYYVPMLLEEDLENQAKMREERKRVMAAYFGDKVLEAAKGAPLYGLDPKIFRKEQVVNPKWDHIEVCLRAFVTIHLMSEKRVIITRQTRKLQKHVKCSNPLPHHVNLRTEQDVEMYECEEDEESIEAEDEKDCNIDGVLRDVRVWMAEQAKQAQKFNYAVNPRTLLPVGLVLPASVTCMPVFPRGPPPKPYLPQDQDRDVNIVCNFFSHQLWKPEYIGGVP